MTKEKRNKKPYILSAFGAEKIPMPNSISEIKKTPESELKKNKSERTLEEKEKREKFEALAEEFNYFITESEVADRFSEVADLVQNKDNKTEKKARELEEYLSKPEHEGRFNMVLSSLEARDMTSFFSELKEGDYSVTCLTPEGKLEIKELNDKSIGYYATNRAIFKRHRELSEREKKLSEDYKLDTFKISKDWVEKEEEKLKKVNPGSSEKEMKALVEQRIQERVNEKLRKTEAEMNKYLIKIARNQLKGASPEKQKNLESLLKDMESGNLSYKMTAGIAKVGKPASDNPNDLSHLRLAFAQSNHSARTARENPKKNEYCEIFSEEKMTERLSSIKDMRKEIKALSQDNNFCDDKGNVYEIFSKDKSGRYQSNTDIINGIRSKELVPADNPQQKELFELLKKYKDSVNNFDYVIFYTSKEITGKEPLKSGEVLAEKLKKQHKTAQRLRKMKEEGQKLEKEDYLIIADQMKKESKDPDICTSKAEHHKRALKNKTYIVADVEKIGVKLWLTHEQKVQELEDIYFGEKSSQLSKEEKKRLADKAFNTIGDSVTQDLRKAREDCAKVFDKHGLEPGSFVGGDEVIYTIPETEQLEEIMWGLKQAISGRVVSTQIAEVEKDIKAGQDKDELIREHIKAGLELDNAIEIAKAIEKKTAELKQKIKRKLNKVNGELEKILQEKGFADYVVCEKDTQRREQDDIYQNFELKIKDEPTKSGKEILQLLGNDDLINEILSELER